MNDSFDMDIKDDVFDDSTFNFNPNVPEFVPGHTRWSSASLSSPPLSRSQSECSDSDNPNQLLWDAAKAGNCELIRCALREGAEIGSSANRKGSTALHIAAEKGHLEAVAMLITLGANPNQIDSKGWSPLDRCVWAGQRATTELLLASGANVNITDYINRTPLHATAIRGNVELAKILIDSGAELNVRDRKFHMTPADWAKKYKRKDVYRLLLRSTSVSEIEDKISLN